MSKEPEQGKKRQQEIVPQKYHRTQREYEEI
jgi:hypothetical protein